MFEASIVARCRGPLFARMGYAVASIFLRYGKRWLLTVGGGALQVACQHCQQVDHSEVIALSNVSLYSMGVEVFGRRW